MNILGFKVTIVPADGKNVVHKIKEDCMNVPLSVVLKKAGLNLEGMQITDAGGKNIDPSTFLLTASLTFEKEAEKEKAVSKPKVPGFWATLLATERSSGS